MKITRRQLRRIIRESISQNEIEKIEDLYWNPTIEKQTLPGFGFQHEKVTYDTRSQAMSLVSAMGIDPKLLKIWMFVMPSGEILNDDFGLSIAEVKKVIESYNNHPDAPFEVSFDDATILEDVVGESHNAYAGTDIPLSTDEFYAGHTEDDYYKMEKLLRAAFDDKVASLPASRKN